MSIKEYAIAVGLVGYHLVAFYAILMLINLHIFPISIVAILWLLTLPLTAYKAAPKVGNAITKFFS